MTKTEEHQYLDLIEEVLTNGTFEMSRNGNTYSIFGHQMTFSLKNGTLPLLTTKRVGWKTCFRELMWFVRGCTNNAELQKQNVKIWNANASREFLDSRGLTDLSENDLGPIYGHQWRHFNASYVSCHTDYTGQGIDQLQNIIHALKDPEQHHSRRLVMSAWNPCQLHEMALPPCHVLVQFKVRDHKYLSCSLYQRSGDIGLGIPFNIASYSLLTHILAKHCGLEAEKFIHTIGDAHIYEDHKEALQEQITRTPYSFPQIEIKTQKDNIDYYNEHDIVWKTPYQHHSEIYMKMSA
tara:strand:+ start:1394 stop:2275 length:882 start_codon:yes stop_codon:yes gene_type:complete